MDKQRFIGIFALTAACVLSPAASAQDTPTLVVSSEFMNTLEEWSSPTATAETLALDSRPELIEEYAALAEQLSGGRTVAEIFAENLPATWTEIEADLSSSDGEAPTAAEIVAYAMAGDGEEFQAWQASLADSGGDFRSFVAESHPEVAAEIEEIGPSPADLGVGLRDFAEGKGTAGGLDLLAFEEVPQLQLKKCACFAAVSFDDFPGPGWVSQVNEHRYQRSGFSDKKLDQLDYTLQARGAARDLEFSRRSEHQTTEAQRDWWGDASQMRVNLTCLRMPVREGSNPTACAPADTCKGKLYAHIGYGSRVYENHSVGGIWTKDAKTLSADFARLTYQAPGSSFSTTLFAKGVAVAGSYQLDWGNPYNLATQFYNIAGVPLSTAPAPSSALSALGTNLNDTNLSGLAGLAYLTGVSGSYAINMKAGWGNIGQPLNLLPGQTHTFRLGADSRAYGRGLGGQSDSRNHIDSAYYFMAVTRSFSCPATGYGPVDRAFWNYGRAGDAPYDLNALRNLVRDNANSAGSAVTNVNAVPGQYP